MKPVWATRTGANMAGPFASYSETTKDDVAYLPHDLAGSIAHVMGLHNVGLLDQATARTLIAGLQDLQQAFDDGSFTLDAELEDVHMNIESALAERLGEVSKRLHTGRSRNDQVATCIVLRSRSGLLDLAQQLGSLSAALTSQAAANTDTPWVAKTHGRPAQPATLAYLLVAHALRLQGLQKEVLDTFATIGVSPLGCGAIAGSSLPLQPAYTAQLLALAPPANGLLSTGTRDVALSTITVASKIGFALSSLAQDILDLFEEGAVALPPGTTTGSSLMPHKRNPDALELTRGVGKSLTALPSQAFGMLAGLGLGYQRDMQAIKPLIDQALTQSTTTAAVLHQVTVGMEVNVDVLTKTLDAPGITATDAVEAVVKLGMPFRAAYEGLAKASKARESGQNLADAINNLDWNATHRAAAISALQPNITARNTLGGPSPTQVSLQITQAQAAAGTIAKRMIEASHLVAQPAALVGRNPQELVP